VKKLLNICTPSRRLWIQPVRRWLRHVLSGIDVGGEVFDRILSGGGRGGLQFSALSSALAMDTLSRR
jgi:hypothetical protein